MKCLDKMLHENCVRHRRTFSNIKTPMVSFRRTMNKTVNCLRYLPLKMKCLLLLFIILGGLLCAGIFWHQLRNRLTEESFLEVEKCPACYGISLCHALFDGQARFYGLSRIRAMDTINVKNVHFGKYQNKDIVLKKLRKNEDLQKMDDQICLLGNRKKGCDVGRVSYLTDFSREVRESRLEVRHLEHWSNMFYCPSSRLVNQAAGHYKEKAKADIGHMLYRDKVQFLVTAMMNSEPLLLQTFPASEGWPFPEYIGACGRFIAVKNTGKLLQEFINAPWELRAHLAYQVLNMANLLVNNEDGFALYWTKLNFDDFTVDKNSQVIFTDVENIIVVDKAAVEKAASKGWNDPLETPFFECDTNCPVAPASKLCKRTSSDNNLYLACYRILSQYVTEEGVVGGLLHDMPQKAKDIWDLPYLLNECVRPGRSHGRWKVLNKLLQALSEMNKNPDVKT